MSKVVFYSSFIRPGGGPAGYVFNLMKAAENGTTKNTFLFCGYKIDDRSLNSDTWPFLLKVKAELAWRGVYFPLFPDLLELKDMADGAIVAIHGHVHPRLVYTLKKRARKIIFMPHSPSLHCDEYVMLCASSGGRLSKRRFEYFRWAEHVSIAYSDHVVFPSPRAGLVYKQAYRDQLNLGKDHYIPSGVYCNIDDESVVRSYTKESNRREIKVGFIGRYNIHKGFDIYCRVAEKMSSVSLRFLSFGDGPLKPIPGCVDNRGWVNDISSAILECDIILVPNKVSYYDLLPLEAACHGRPIVFTPVGGNIDQAESLPDSVLCKSVSVDDVVSGIEEAVTRKSLDYSWGIKNGEKYLEFFTEKAMLNRWDEFINAIA